MSKLSLKLIIKKLQRAVNTRVLVVDPRTLKPYKKCFTNIKSLGVIISSDYSCAIDKHFSGDKRAMVFSAVCLDGTAGQVHGESSGERSGRHANV